MKSEGIFRGKVIKFDCEKGFGFVKLLEKKVGNNFQTVVGLGDAFVHNKDVIMNDGAFRKLVAEQVVELTVYKSQKGFSGKEVKSINGQYDDYGEKNYNSESYNTLI